MKLKIGQWVTDGKHIGKVIEKLGFIFIEDSKTKEHIFIRPPVSLLSEDEVKEHLRKEKIPKKKVPKLKTKADFARFLTEYYRNGNIMNFLNEYDFKDEKH
jgi:DNA-directed RNA polymerase subunit H (RpoH/RPB5)